MSVVWVVIPAHNEESIIAETIRSLKRQTIKPQRIIVIADNCTDKTVSIASLEGAEVIITVNNKNRKAGAYNQFLSTISDEEVDFLLLMDADTIIADNAIEVGVQRFVDEKVAAVCSKAGVQKLDRSCKFSENLLYRLQKIEYGLYDSQRIETKGYIKVVHGMAALHRWRCLREAGLFNEESITEDYYLTLVYKKLGYKVIPEINMKAWTTVPLTLRELCKQRIRWYRGGIDALKDLGWNKGTYKDILQHIWVNLLTFVLSTIYAGWVSYMMKVKDYTLKYHWFILVLIIFCIYDRVYRIIKYVDNIEVLDWLVVLVLILELVYNQLQTAILYVAYIKSFMGLKKTW